jgi:hypothetical protein
MYWREEKARACVYISSRPINILPSFTLPVTSINHGSHNVVDLFIQISYIPHLRPIAPSNFFSDFYVRDFVFVFLLFCSLFGKGFTEFGFHLLSQTEQTMV